MDMDQFKEKWNRIDKKLEQDIALNQEIGKLSIKQKSGSAIDHFVYNGMIEIFASVILMIFSTLLTIKYAADWRFLLSGIVFDFFMIINLIFNSFALSKIDKIDLFTQNVLEVSKSIALFKQYVLFYYKYLCYTIPLMLFSIFPFTAMAARRINIFEHVDFMIYRFSVGLILAYVAFYLLFKYFFQRSIRRVESYLEYLQAFESNGEEN